MAAHTHGHTTHDHATMTTLLPDRTTARSTTLAVTPTDGRVHVRIATPGDPDAPLPPPDPARQRAPSCSRGTRPGRRAAAGGRRRTPRHRGRARGPARGDRAVRHRRLRHAGRRGHVGGAHRPGAGGHDRVGGRAVRGLLRCARTTQHERRHGRRGAPAAARDPRDGTARRARRPPRAAVVRARARRRTSAGRGDGPGRAVAPARDPRRAPGARHRRRAREPRSPPTCAPRVGSTSSAGGPCGGA